MPKPFGVTRTNGWFYNLCIKPFTYLLHVLALLSPRDQGADTKSYFKHMSVMQNSTVSVVQNFIGISGLEFYMYQ